MTSTPSMLIGGDDAPPTLLRDATAGSAEPTAFSETPGPLRLRSEAVGLWRCRSCLDLHDSSTSWVAVQGGVATVICAGCAHSLLTPVA